MYNELWVELSCPWSYESSTLGRSRLHLDNKRSTVLCNSILPLLKDNCQ